RRLLQRAGAEVIHLGHNRSAAAVVDCAIAEDAHAIAITSYQGGHLEYLRYTVALLAERGADIRVFAGGGGTILPDEIEQLHRDGVARVYSPDDGRALGLQGMIDDLLSRCPGPRDVPPPPERIDRLAERDPGTIGRLISLAENDPAGYEGLAPRIRAQLPAQPAPVLGITGTGGAGKSSLVDELLRRFLLDHPARRVAVISIDPTKRKTHGALLGDRIRMNTAEDPRVFVRSMATRQVHAALSPQVGHAIE